MNSIPQTGPYVPRRKSGFAAFISTMSQTIARNPWKYMVSPAEAQTLVQQAEKFFAADELTNAESTRNKVTILERDQIRASITPLFTGYAQRIKHNDGISDPDKIAIGVRPRNRGHSRRNVPTSSPILKFIGAGNGTHTLSYNDSMTPTLKAKPFGAVCLELFMDVTSGTEAPSLERAKFVGTFTRNRFGIMHDVENAGKTATFWGRWSNRRGEVGPWSNPISFTIAFGGATGLQSNTQSPEQDGEQRPLKLAA